MTILSRIDTAPATPMTGDLLLRWSMTLLVGASWLSGAIFGAYILAFFGGVAIGGNPGRWNEALPELHDSASPVATLAMGLHFTAGGILLLLGPIQLIGALRRAMPALHRWIGRAYVLSAALAGLGGLGFIATKGTIGGPFMSLGFGIYGALMVLAAGMTYAHARARRFDLHRAWAIRLFALMVGSWLYRMDYGFWFAFADGMGHETSFTGWFDRVMIYFFYIPNLIVAEIAIRARRAPGGVTGAAASAVFLIATAFIAYATWSFTTRFWGPGIVEGIAQATL